MLSSKKGTLILTLFLAAILMFSGCGGDTIMQESSTDGSYVMYYSKFSTERSLSFNVKEDKKITVIVVTNKGELNMDVFRGKEDGGYQSYYTGDDLPTGKHELDLKKGAYRIDISGDKHSGGFTILY